MTTIQQTIEMQNEIQNLQTLNKELEGSLGLICRTRRKYNDEVLYNIEIIMIVLEQRENKTIKGSVQQLIKIIL